MLCSGPVTFTPGAEQLTRILIAIRPLPRKMAESIESLVSIAGSVSTPSTKRRIQIFRNQIPFIISNSGKTEAAPYFYTDDRLLSLQRSAILLTVLEEKLKNE